MSEGSIGLLVSDIDGTIVRHDKSLAPATIGAVERLRAAGVPTTLISARPPSGILPIAKALGLDGPVAAFNGGTLIAADGSVSEAHRMPEHVARDVLAMGLDAGVDPWMFADGRWMILNPDNAHVDREKKSSAQEPVVVDDLAPWLYRTDKLVLVSDDAPKLHALAERSAHHRDRATVAQSQTYYLDVTALEGNKGSGIEALARAYGVPLDRVAAIGDMPNDLPMLTRAGIAIAMGQAPDAVKQAAHDVTTSNEEDGVAHAIDTLLLPRVGQRA